MLIAAPDLSQIEPRVLNWVVGNHELLQQIRDGFPIYEAHARDTMGWTGGRLKKENPKKYGLAKSRLIGLGYGCGWEKFITVAMTMAQFDVTEDDEAVALGMSVDGKIYQEPDGTRYVLRAVRRQCPMSGTVVEHVKEPVYGCNSRVQVADYREKNPKVTALWRQMQNALEDAVGSDLVLELPSGRVLTYRNVRREVRTVKDRETGKPVKKTVLTAEADGVRKVYYGGRLTENICQGIGRDVFSVNMLAIADAGIWPMWSVHDEAVCIAASPEEAEKARLLMAQTPEWLQGCPVESEVTVSDRYKK